MHVTLQTFSVNPAEVVSAQSASSLVNNSPEILQDLNLVFSGSIVFSLRAPVQPVRGPRGSSRRPPQRGRTETRPLEPRAISSEYETLFVKRCTKPLCLCRRHYRAKIALHAGIVVSRNPPQAPPPRRIQGDGRGVAFLIHVNGVMFTLTLAQHISEGLTFMALSQLRVG